MKNKYSSYHFLTIFSEWMKGHVIQESILLRKNTFKCWNMFFKETLTPYSDCLWHPNLNTRLSGALVSNLQVITSTSLTAKTYYCLRKTNVTDHLHITLRSYCTKNSFNRFHVTGLFLYPLKALEKQRLADLFSEYKKDQRHEMSHNMALA